MVETYETSGVDIAAGEEAVRRIKEHVSSTFRPEAIGDIGGFGGLFDFTRHGYKKPVLVSTTDGVGTKAHRGRRGRSVQHHRHRLGGHVRGRSGVPGGRAAVFLGLHLGAETRSRADRAVGGGSG